MRHAPLKALPYPISKPCPKCGSPMDLDHPVRRGDECDTNKLIGECAACGELVIEDRRESADADNESEYMDREFDRKHYGN